MQKNALLHYIISLKQYFFITANINTIITVITVIVFDHAKENNKYIIFLWCLYFR